MSSTNEAIKIMQDGGIIVGPSKAANAGGVACSCIEMGQNSGKMQPPSSLRNIDLTPQRIFSVTDDTKKIVSAIEIGRAHV